jgi:stage II sporulation protein P
MNMKKRSTRLGAALLVLGLVLRLGGVTAASAHSLRQMDAEPLGILRWGPGGVTWREETKPPVQPDPLPIFTAADLAQIHMKYATGSSYRPDLEELIISKLRWDLDSGQPAVLIVHSHGSEAFTKMPGQDYIELANTRTQNTDYNMIAVGELLAHRLEAAGIRVIHDRTMHDDPSYNAAYTNSRAAVESYLAQYPEIQLVLDLHRDSAQNPDGSKYATGVTVDGQKIAQLMLVMGSDAGGYPHPRWEENLAVALKMLAVLEEKAPGITRTTTLRASRYNQDLHPGMLLVEVGSSGNTLDQAKAAVEILADAIIALKDGAN